MSTENEQKSPNYEELEIDNEKDTKLISKKKSPKKHSTSYSMAPYIIICIVTLACIFIYNETFQSNSFAGKDEKKPTGKFTLKLDSPSGKKYEDFNPSSYASSLKTYFKSKIVTPVKIIELKIKPKYEPALQVTFDMGDSGLKYEVGDTIGILPKNADDKVELFAKKFGYDLEKVITYDVEGDKNGLKLPYPNGMTVRTALTELVNLNCLVSDKILAKLQPYVSNDKEKEEIKKILGDEKSIEEYKNKRYNILDITEVFPSVKIPFEKLHEILPFIKPRLYTVASSPNAWPNKFNICITLVSWKNYKDIEVFGLNSGYLNNMLKTAKLEKTRVIINKGSFKLPDDPKIPIMMICTGSGISPYIAFLEELKFRGKQPYETYLIYGSKTRKSDFIYEDTLMKFKEEGVLTDVITAFSRDQSYKIYVQDRLKERFANKLNDLIKKGLRVYVCGAGSMGKRIKKVIQESIGDENYKKFIDNKQFIGEFWENK